MNDNREGSSCCYFHPREAVVGVCAVCLKERLIILAAKQGHVSPKNQNNQKSFRILRRKPSIKLPKVLALGSFLQLLEFRSQRPPDSSYENHDSSDEGSIASLEDSFISIKFTDKGQAFWDDKKVRSFSPFTESLDKATTRHEQTFKEKKVEKTVVEHANPRKTLRWHNRIGHLFHVAQWKRPSKAGACHAGMSSKMEGTSDRSWIRSLTKRRQQDN